MKNANSPSAAFQEVLEITNGKVTRYSNHRGLSKREELAARFMAAWIVHHGAANNYSYSSQEAANLAIGDADTLLAELERTK